MPNNPTYNEKALFRRISEGDEEAFELLFNAYVPRLIPFARKLTNDQEVAREMVQETFLRLWLSRDKLADIENPAGYVFTAASHQCYKFLHRKAKQENLVAAEATEENVTDSLNVRELNTLIHSAVKSLSEQRRKVFMLSREKGLSIPEIAQELGLSPNTVKNTLVSALKSVREYLELHGYVLPAVLLLCI